MAALDARVREFLIGMREAKKALDTEGESDD